MMQKALCLILLFLCVAAAGCCSTEHSQTNLPKAVRGWQETTIDSGIVSVGEFVLKKGESTNNGKFVVELIEVIPSKRCVGLFAEPTAPARAKIKFYRLSDHKDLGETTAPKSSGTRLVDYEISDPEYGITTVFINEINTKDGWVWFNLWR